MSTLATQTARIANSLSKLRLKMKTSKLLNLYFGQAVEKLVVTAPFKKCDTLNFVVGVNHHLYQESTPAIVAASSCTKSQK